MMVKIFLDPGHGGVDTGASGNGLLEKNVTLQIALAVREYVQGYQNTTVNMSRTTDKTVSLTERTNMANSWKADYFLSIHVNAGGGTGFESFIFQGLSATSETAKIRNDIHNQVIKVNGLLDRGKKQMNLHVLRETTMPACLTENGFIDTMADASKMKQPTWIDQVAKAHAEGIAIAFGLKKIVVSTPVSEGKYEVKQALTGFYTALDAKNHLDPRTTVQKGTYYIFNRADGMINVTKQKGIPGSWINPGDVANNIHVGSRVKVKQSASNYATGEKIPAWVKGRTFTVQQVDANRVLLKEIYSWVNKGDVV